MFKFLCEHRFSFIWDNYRTVQFLGHSTIIDLAVFLFLTVETLPRVAVPLNILISKKQVFQCLYILRTFNISYFVDTY